MTADALDLVLSKLDGVRQQGGYWMARCPATAHDDTKASLSIARGTEQPVIFKCHAGCHRDDILDGLGLTVADVSNPRDERPELGEWTPRGPAVRVYDYTDAQGRLIFQVCRTADKQFPQRRPDPSAKSGWRWTLGGVDRVPYRLPRIRQAATGPVAGRVLWIAEGEKDVHALERAGAVATTSPGGAGKWRDSYVQYLAGIREVVIVADADEPGRKHAADVARSVARHVTAVRVVEAARGKDASDHLAAGLGLEDFQPVQPASGDASVSSIGTKKEERTKTAGPPVPAADPAMYAGILGEITMAAAPTTEADPVGIYASLLAGTGMLVGPKPHVQVGNTRHPMLIWALLMGRTGSGRKGEATGTAEIFLRSAAPDSADRRMVTGLSSGEGLIERIRDDDDAAELDITDKRLLVIEPEFTSVMARSKREGSTLAAVQRQAWDGRALAVLNRKQLRASSSHVAIIGHITPQEFRLRLAEADMTGGTYNRYLPVYVDRSQRLPIPEGVGHAEIDKLSLALQEGIQAASETGRVQLGDDASRLWTGELYDELTESDDEDRAEAEFTRRAAPYCLRVAGLLAVLDGRQLISKADLTAAAALVRYSMASARFVLDRQARNPRLDRIQRALDAAGQPGLTRSAISALFSRNLTKEVLDELLLQLTAGGEYEAVRLATKGRPAETYRRVVSSFFVPKESGQ